MDVNIIELNKKSKICQKNSKDKITDIQKSISFDNINYSQFITKKEIDNDKIGIKNEVKNNNTPSQSEMNILEKLKKGELNEFEYIHHL